MQNVSLLLICFSLFYSVPGFAQDSVHESDGVDSLKTRKIAVAASTASGIAITTAGLSYAWYQDYERVPFHWFNDRQQWLQMDKAGHWLTAYHFGKAGYNSFRWAGFNENLSTWIGANTGFILLLGIEVLDGYSAAWGASPSDLLSNGLGSMTFIAQQKLWKEQRITPKFSFQQSRFASMNPELLGDGLREEWLKDYNGQIYWLSLNLKSFSPQSQLPPWLNIALGYGADGLLRGSSSDQENGPFANIPRAREFYLSVDADLWRINTSSKALKSFFRILSFVKIPAPGIKWMEGQTPEFKILVY